MISALVERVRAEPQEDPLSINRYRVVIFDVDEEGWASVHEIMEGFKLDQIVEHAITTMAEWELPITHVRVGMENIAPDALSIGEAMIAASRLKGTEEDFGPEEPVEGYRDPLGRTLKTWTDDEKRFFRIDENYEDIQLVIPGYDIHGKIGSAWVTSNGECTLVVSIMGMQSGHQSWGVMYTEIDGYINSRTGNLGPYHAGADDLCIECTERVVNEAIFELMKCERWIADPQPSCYDPSGYPPLK